LPEDWLGDIDSDELFDIYEKVIDTDPFNPDTDSDELPDGYEVLTLSTDPLEIDTDFNGIWDKDEDFDSDNLNNLGEYQNKTGPFIPDTDEDGLLDGDEVHTYATDPLNPDTDGDKLLDGEEGYNGTIFTKYGVYFDPLMPDTDGDGELDGDEVFGQTKQQQVQTHDEKITNITVDMSTNGNIDRNLSVESMYNVDTMSTNAYALVGEPFNFTSSTSFESATITFTVDQSKLGDTKFDDLIILWYNEESQNFEEMPTSRDSVNSTVSTTTTHFSQYMVVDSVKWYEQWQNSCNELNKMWIGNTTYRKNLKTIFLLDCSYKMESVDDIDYSIEIGYNGVTEENYYSIINDMNNPSDVEFCLKNFGRRSCDRTTVCENVINTMNSGDSAAIITFSNEVLTNTGMSSNWSTLTEGIQRVNNDGEASNLNLVLPTALSYIDDNIYDTYRIIVVTHSNIAYYYDGLLSYNYDNVELNIVNLGPGSISPSIEGIVNSTGGKVYDIVNASQLVNQVGEIVNTPPQFIGKDSDGDTIPDIVESYGLKPNGQPIGTNPNLKDTDFDGLDDNVEINYLTEELVYPLTFEQTYMFSCTSDPTKADSDGDGLDDYYYTYEYPEETTEFYKDNRPLKKGIYSSELEKIIIGELTIISECPDDGMLDWKWAWPPVNVNAGHSFFVYKSYVNDTLDFSGFYRGFELGTWERQEPGYYKINVNEKVAIGNSGDTQDYSGLDQITRGGIYFNREVKNAFNGGKTYGINSYLTKKITQNQLDKVIKVCKNHNYYDLIYNNCAYVACEAWNQSFNDNLNCWTIVGEDILYLPKTLRKSISKRKESKDNYDILFEFSFCN